MGTLAASRSKGRGAFPARKDAPNLSQVRDDQRLAFFLAFFVVFLAFLVGFLAFLAFLVVFLAVFLAALFAFFFFGFATVTGVPVNSPSTAAPSSAAFSANALF